MAWRSCIVSATSAILMTILMTETAGQDLSSGVKLSLRGVDIANDGYVNVNDIGVEDHDALLCHTDKPNCCTNMIGQQRAGEWYYPNGTTVGTIGYNIYTGHTSYFFRSRGTQTVLLRRESYPSETGKFCCEVPNAYNSIQSICANVVHIGNLTVSPFAPATKITGEMFSLVCSADIHPLPTHGHAQLSIFEWFFDNSSLPSGVIVSDVTKNGDTTYISTLTFSSLDEIHTGVYTCRIGYTAVSTTITVKDPVVTIVDSGTQTAGENYALACVVNGIENAPSLRVIYRWTKNNGSTQFEVGTSNTLSFSPLKLSDDGQYICQVTIGSRMYGAIEYINVQIPPPSRHIVSNQTNPIRPIGSAVSLTCTVELNPAVNVPMTAVTIQLSGPAGRTLNTTTPGSVSGSTYTITAIISSFGREQSGEYTCTVSIGSSRSWSATKIVTVGVYLLLKGTLYTNNSDIFINEIGETDHISLIPTQNNALQCITDKSPCCRSFPRVGEWYFPNGTVILGPIFHGLVFYRNRGNNDGTVNLNYINSTLPALSPTGLFCCVVPDMDNENQRLCANLDIVIVTITPSGNNTAGEIYNLECSVNGYSATFQWSDESGVLINNQGPRTITTSPVTSQIQFSPLYQSHGGKYTCSVNVGRVTESKSISLSVRVPRPSIHIVSNQTNPIRPIGSAVSLTCIVELISVVDVLPVTVTIQLSDPAGNPLNTTTPSVSGSTYTTTATISSFGREQSGIYTCTVSIGSSGSWSATKKVTVGVYLLLKGTLYTNNSDIFINEIGETDHISLIPTQNNALQCITDKSPCCRSFPRVGEWYFPNGTVILGPIVHGLVFYRNRGDNDGTVNLNYINSTLPALSPTGLFCCVLPDMDNENQTLCANLDIVIVTITRSGNNTAGEIYNLECSVNGHSATFQWSDESGDLIIDNNQGPRTITTSSVTSRIQLSPLHESHGGKYTCSVNVGRVTESKSTSLSVRVPNVAVKMKHHGVVSIGGQGFSLSCVVSGAENLSPTITYNWIKDNGTRILVDSHGSVLSFPSLRLSDAGQYSCQVIVDSPYLRDNLDVTSITFSIHLQVPQPVVKLVSDTPNPILSDSSPTLTCAVELSPAVDVPVTVNTEWTRPDGSILTSGAPPVMRSFTHYTSDLKLNYVESADSGNYNCTVSIGGKVRTSVQRKIVIGDSMFQLRLMYTDDCRLWYKSGNNEFELYKYHIEEALTEAIESRCKCYFPRANLLEASFSCGSSPNLTTYRNTLIGTHNFNATQLIGFIQDWVTSEPIIKIENYSVWLDSSCPVAIASLKEPECGEVRHCPCANDPNIIKCMEFLGDESFFGCINSCI